MVSAFSFFPIFVERIFHKFLIYLLLILVELGVFFFARYLRKKKPYHGILQSIAFAVFFVCVIFFGIKIDVIENTRDTASIFMVILICGQFVFVMNPLKNFLLNAVTVLVFICFSRAFKPPSVWILDCVDASAAGLSGIIVSWYTSYINIKEIVTTRKLEAERNQFKEESIKDALTGLHNRRDFDHSVNIFISVCRQVRQTIYIIMMDVDHFKNYNDHYGHPQGDHVLIAVGKMLRRLQEEECVYAARVGGEEFIVMGTENRIAEVERITIKIRQMMIDLRIPHEKSPVAPYVTISLGLYIMRGGNQDSAEQLYSKVDQALYKAKESGRDRIIAFDSGDDSMRLVEPLPPEQNVGRSV
jgi:diguanylate cyclase (GGDEF)-like protein